MRMVATQFIGAVAAVVGQVTELRAVDAMAVSALKLRVGVTWFDAR